MKWQIIGLITVAWTASAELPSINEAKELLLKTSMKAFTAPEADIIRTLINIVTLPKKMTKIPFDDLPRERKPLLCYACSIVLGVVRILVRIGMSITNLINNSIWICHIILREDYSVCYGMITLNLPVIVYILKEIPFDVSTTFCGLLLQDEKDPNVCPYNDPRFDWEVDLPPKRPVQSHLMPTPSAPLTVAIISDVHIDPKYDVTGIADCSRPSCCRKQTHGSKNWFKTGIRNNTFNNTTNMDAKHRVQNMKAAKSNEFEHPVKAGYWGSYYKCDTPVWAYDNTIEEIKRNHEDLDIIYYLGDTVDHHMWETTYELVKDVNGYVIDKIREVFGNKVKVFPAIGNHDSQPSNVMAPYSLKDTEWNSTWIYNVLANKYSDSLTYEARKSMAKWGQYTMLVGSNLRVISLNSIVAYRFNWWQVYDPLESKRHLEWLVEALFQAEQAGEKVHIISHIPPGTFDFSYTWTREYQRIVERFATTITAQFVGHTHSDEIYVIYDKSWRPVNMAWGAGSVTTFYEFNPNYKVATLDPITYEPLDIETFVYNLTQANLKPYDNPHWYKLYSIRNTYGAPDLSPKSMDDFFISSVTDRKFLLELYSVFWKKDSSADFDCDVECQLDNVCRAVTTVLWETDKCLQLRQLYHS